MIISSTVSSCLTIVAADERVLIVGFLALRAICLRRVISFAQLC